MYNFAINIEKKTDLTDHDQVLCGITYENSLNIKYTYFFFYRYPLLRHSLCTVRRAKIILRSLTFIALGLYAPLLVFADAKPLCTVEPLWQDAAGVFNVLDTIVTFVIPVSTLQRSILFHLVEIASQKYIGVSLLLFGTINAQYNNIVVDTINQIVFEALYLEVSNVFFFCKDFIAQPFLVSRTDL